MTFEQIGLSFETAATSPLFGEAWPYHGRTTGYRYGCRCPDCREAKRIGRPLLRSQCPPDWPHHGTDTGYRYGCRCETCRVAHAEQIKASSRRSGQPRTCNLCDSTYVHVPGSGTGYAYCSPRCRAGAKRAHLDLERAPCLGCATPMRFRKGSTWRLCGTCLGRIPPALVNPLRSHHASVEFILRVSAHPICEICGDDVTRRIQNRHGTWRNNLALDHDHACCPNSHSCGSCLRGLLCVRCNSGIGYLGDDAERLLAAADYLARFQKGGEDQ